MRKLHTYSDKEGFLIIYKGYIRPHLEYAIQAWSPYLKGDINQWEKVQKRATKLVYGYQKVSYEKRLRRLGLTTLQQRRLRGDLIETYKIITGKENVDPTFFLTLDSGNYITRGHPYKLEIKRSRLELRRNFYSHRVVHHWNSLPEHVVMADIVNTFKNKLDKEWGTVSSSWTLRPSSTSTSMLVIIIIIMTRRRLWSVATALRDVQAPLHSATSVSSWLLFRRQLLYRCLSRTTRKSSPVHTWAEASFHCNDLLQGLVCRYAGIQSDYVPVQCMTFLVDYVSNVRQASCISYVDVLHVILPSAWRPVFDADIPCEKTAACGYHLPIGSMCRHRTAESEEHCRFGKVAVWCPNSISVVANNAAWHAWQRRPLQCVDVCLGSIYQGWLYGSQVPEFSDCFDSVALNLYICYNSLGRSGSAAMFLLSGRKEL